MAKSDKFEPVADAFWVPLEKLVVDDCNIRGGEWDYDKDLVKSIERTGVQQPLVVRPLNPPIGDASFGIVAGSRRYNAAVEAELDEVPCRVREMDDEEAMLHSMEENRNRRPTAKWRDIEFVGEVAERFMARGMSKSAAHQKVSERIGMSRITIAKYHVLYKLQPLLKGLLREPEDRTEEQRDFLRLILPAQHVGPIELQTGELVSKHLSKMATPRQAEIAVELGAYHSDYREAIVKRIARNPHLSVKEAAGESIRRAGEARSIYFPRDLFDGMVEACMDLQTTLPELIQHIMADWLWEREYLESKTEY